MFFVDENKNRVCRTGDNERKERASEGYKKTHMFSVRILCDIFGIFIRVEVTNKDAESDRNIHP